MKINISEIENKEDKRIHLDFSEVIKEFNEEIPINADLDVEIIGELIRIKGTIHAQVVLTCDICLKDFTKEFNINVDEAYIKDSLNMAEQKEIELKDDGFVEDLNGKDEIDITDFIYQCVILDIPNKCVCDINCNGDENLRKYLKAENSDPRLEIFKTIKIEKDN